MLADKRILLIIGGGNMGLTYAKAFLRSHITTKKDLMILEKSQDKERESVLREICERFGVYYVHIHHLLCTGSWIVPFLKDLGMSVLVSFHDFYAICPTAHLVDDAGRDGGLGVQHGLPIVGGAVPDAGRRALGHGLPGRRDDPRAVAPGALPARHLGRRAREPPARRDYYERATELSSKLRIR